jgi:hypothetical protein
MLLSNIFMGDISYCMYFKSKIFSQGYRRSEIFLSSYSYSTVVIVISSYSTQTRRWLKTLPRCVDGAQHKCLVIRCAFRNSKAPKQRNPKYQNDTTQYCGVHMCTCFDGRLLKRSGKRDFVVVVVVVVAINAWRKK